MQNKLNIIGLIFLFISCKFSPDNIRYGFDECSYCRMTIVDNTHSSQFITSKWKSYNFDSIECMLDYLYENNDTNYLKKNDKILMLVSNFKSPGKMLNVKDAKFLISKKISSPMGANISAFSSIEEILEIDNSGEIIDWNNLIENYNILNKNNAN